MFITQCWLLALFGAIACAYARPEQGLDTAAILRDLDNRADERQSAIAHLLERTKNLQDKLQQLDTMVASLQAPLKTPDRCAVDDERRVACDLDDWTPESCVEHGCCYDDSAPGDSAPQCFLANTADEQTAASTHFFSAFTTSEYECVIGAIIPFPSLLTSVGGGYDTSTSIYTCPVSGYYYVFFSVSLYNFWLEQVLMQPGIYRDGTLISEAAENMGSDVIDHHGMTGQSVVTQCNAGSEIYILYRGGTDARIKGSADRRLSQFGAMLIGLQP